MKENADISMAEKILSLLVRLKADQENVNVEFKIVKSECAQKGEEGCEAKC